MKSSDRSILIGVGVLALVAVFWFLVLAPKRHEASDLQSKVDDLNSQVSAAQQSAATAKQAEDQYASNYRRVVSLGKAAPADGDEPSFVQQLQAKSDKAKVDFQSLTLAADSSGVSAAAPTTAASTSTSSSSTSSSASSPTDNSQTDASTETTSSVGSSVESAAGVSSTPTETSAATLPLGAAVGSAGLPVMPYDLIFSGGFFQISDLFGALDSSVASRGSTAKVDGRLVTIDGFEMSSDGNPNLLTTDVHLTSYVLPSAQGLTAGATQAAPPAEIPPAAATPVSTPTPAAAVSP